MTGTDSLMPRLVPGFTVHQELQGEQGLGMLLGDRQRPLLGLHIGEVCEPLQVGAQVGDREGVAEELPALLLGLLQAAELLKGGDAGIGPRLGLPGSEVGGGAIQQRQGLFRPARLQQLLGHRGGNGVAAELAGIELGQVGVQVAAGLGDLAQGFAGVGAAVLREPALQQRQPRLAEPLHEGLRQQREPVQPPAA